MPGFRGSSSVRQPASIRFCAQGAWLLRGIAARCTGGVPQQPRRLAAGALRMRTHGARAPRAIGLEACASRRCYAGRIGLRETELQVYPAEPGYNGRVPCSGAGTVPRLRCNAAIVRGDKTGLATLPAVAAAGGRRTGDNLASMGWLRRPMDWLDQGLWFPAIRPVQCQAGPGHRRLMAGLERGGVCVLCPPRCCLSEPGELLAALAPWSRPKRRRQQRPSKASRAEPHGMAVHCLQSDPEFGAFRWFWLLRGLAGTLKWLKAL